MTAAHQRTAGLALASFTGTLILFCAPARVAGGTVTLPTIDQQDIRFSTLFINGERFQGTFNSIAQDKHGFMWFGGAGLSRYDGHGLRHYRHDPDDPGTLSANIVSRIYEDRRGTLWLASDGLNRLDPGSSSFIHYEHNPKDPSSLSSNQINSIDEDREGNLWVGTFHGLNKLDRNTGRVTRYVHDSQDSHSLGQEIVNFVWEDREGILWVGVGNLLDALDPKSGRFTHYSFFREQPG